MNAPQGFWSYVRKDDEGMHGAIIQVAKHVQDEFGVITGGIELDLFLDSMKLKWGDKWRLHIREAIENSTFFIPIVTPRYFKSEELSESPKDARGALRVGSEDLASSAVRRALLETERVQLLARRGEGVFLAEGQFGVRFDLFQGLLGEFQRRAHLLFLAAWST